MTEQTISSYDDERDTQGVKKKKQTGLLAMWNEFIEMIISVFEKNIYIRVHFGTRGLIFSSNFGLHQPLS